MSNNNFIVAIVDQIGQPGQDALAFTDANTDKGTPAWAQGRPPSWKAVHLHGLTERAFIDINDPRAAGWEQRIDIHRALNLPVTFERDPKTSLITRTLLPEV